MKKIHKRPFLPKTAEKKRPSGQRPAIPGPQSMADIFEACGVGLSTHQIEQFWIYHGLLRHHNSELNLTRIHNFDNMVLKLYVDSVLPARMTDLPSPLMDLGSGPGMPGIPLKIMRPDIDLVLAEGRAKRVTFLQAAIAQLGLKNIAVVDRNVTPAYQEPLPGIITRAVESIAQTLQRVQGCLQRHGRVIFMKGPACQAEIEQALHHYAGCFALIDDRAYRIGHTSNERRLVIFERLDAPPRAQVSRAARRHRMQPITSEHNEGFKRLKHMLTGRGIKKEGRALLSGRRPVAETMAAFPERCRSWISAGDQPPPPADAPADMQWLQLSEPLFKTLDLFGTHGPLLCIEVPPLAPWTPADGFPDGCSLLVPFQDPENLGAAIRCAAAFGVTQVILLAESAHPYHPKALRAAGGMTPLVHLRQGPWLRDLAPDSTVLALSADGRDIATAEFPPAFGLLVGLEGEGLPRPWRETALRIPVCPGVESLNAAAATAVALYEWRRKIKLKNER